jgi:hypothetical protein
MLVHHLTKAAAANHKHRVSGSIAYVGACRANYLFVPDSEDRTGRRVLMLDNGGNVAPTAPALAYTIEDPGDGPRVVWSEEPVSITVNEAMPHDRRADASDDVHVAELSDCAEWLRAMLASGPAPAADLRRAGKAAGFPWTTLRRARFQIGAVTRRQGFGPGSRYCWEVRSALNREAGSAMETMETM